MKIEVQLHAILKDLIPGGRGAVDLLEGSIVSDLLDLLAVDPDLRELVTVNGLQVDLSAPLADGDKVQVFPAVAGGSQRSYYIDEGIRLFNEGDYFMSHETLEEHWLEASEAERNFLQGLIHLAVAMHHFHRGNVNGTRSQFHKAARKLESYPDIHEGVDLGRVRRFITSSLERLDNGQTLEDFHL